MDSVMSQFHPADVTFDEVLTVKNVLWKTAALLSLLFGGLSPVLTPYTSNATVLSSRGSSGSFISRVGPYCPEVTPATSGNAPIGVITAVRHMPLRFLPNAGEHPYEIVSLQDLSPMRNGDAPMYWLSTAKRACGAGVALHSWVVVIV